MSCQEESDGTEFTDDNDPDGIEEYSLYKSSLLEINRFFVDKKYLNYFDQIIEEHKKTYNIGDHLFRARIHEYKQERPCPSSGMGIPPKDAVKIGRANPLGILDLYLAETSSTAIAEVRPNVNYNVSVADFEVIEAINVVNLEKVTSAKYLEKYGTPTLTLSTFMFCLSYGFAKPVINNESDYLPYQYFAEYCKSKNLDGIRYVSSAKGFRNDSAEANYNVVLFDDKKVKCKDSNVKTYRIDGINYKTEPVSN